MSVSNSSRPLETEAALRELIPWPGKPIKKLDYLEKHSLNFIAHSPFFVTTTRRADGLVDVKAYGGQPGFVRVLPDNTFVIPVAPGEDAPADYYAGCLFLIPGVNETLRVNGRVRFAGEAAPEAPAQAPVQAPTPVAAHSFETEEVFMHCAKALIRSKLWKNEELAARPHPLGEHTVAAPLHATSMNPAARVFIEKSPFLFLGTNKGENAADISPRGDPPGFVKILDDRTLLIPERRGNNLADNLTNILANPWAGVLFLVPGAEAELWVSGEARVTSAPDHLEMLKEQNKTPIVGIILTIREMQLRPSTALADARFWSPETRIDRKTFPTLGEILREQISTNLLDEKHTAEAIDKDLAFDSKNHLY